VSVSANEMPEFPFLTATGHAEVEVAPDEVKISFQIVNFNEKAEQAMQQLNQVSFETTRFLTKMGVDSDNIETFQISKQSKRARDNKSYQSLHILGYEVTQRFTVTLNNINWFEPVMNKLLTTNLIENISPSFDVSNREEIEAGLIKDAGLKVKNKASMLAAGMGVKLHSVYAINEGSNGGFRPVYQFSQSKAEMMNMRSAESNLFLPQTIKLEKSLSVIYRINN
jgi:hypothetical protein